MTSARTDVFYVILDSPSAPLEETTVLTKLGLV